MGTAGMIIVIVIFAVAAALGLILLISNEERKSFVVTHYTIRDARFSENERPVTAVVIADLHNHSFGSGNAKLLHAIDQAAPEAVFVAGDLVVAIPGHEVMVAADFICKLAKKYSVYYGVGNHEYRMALYPEKYQHQYAMYDRLLKEAGIEMMHNSRTRAKLGNVWVNVYGLEIDREYYKRFSHVSMRADYLLSLFPKPPADQYSILLAHNPDYFSAYAAFGADLTLSGHVHGGLIRLFGRGLISPSTGLFPKYSSGRYTIGERQMIVSRGLGTHTLPIRVCNRPELIVLHFEGKGLENT